MVENYFDLVPVINDETAYVTGENNNVIIINRNRRFAWFKRNGDIALDSYGSKLFRKINGKRTVGDISDELEKELGEEKELARQRVLVFMQILRRMHLIKFGNV